MIKATLTSIAQSGTLLTFHVEFVGEGALQESKTIDSDNKTKNQVKSEYKDWRDARVAQLETAESLAAQLFSELS